ncbi:MULTISPECIES: hypothetical protein [Corallincola]|nr:MULTISPECIES: hypothetical protein [Corallincola]TAA48189.1 hypothetical protein EXY25_02855 [Corallincola spongiicola]
MSANAADVEIFDGSRLFIMSAYDQQTPMPTSKQDPLSLPATAYELITNTLSDVYQKAKFAPSAQESYFPDSKLYEMVALPMVAIPYLDDGYQVELFGQFYDKQRNDLLNIGADDPLYHYYAGEQTGVLNKDFAIGFGTSYLINKDVTVQTMFSSGAIPNHGDSNVAVGIDISF